MSEKKRLTYSPGAFFRRVLMAKASMYVVVEGRELDRPFYDKAARASHAVVRAGFEFWLIEQIEVSASGHQAGGKDAIVKLHDEFYYNFKTLLATHGKCVAFCVDHDNQHIIDSLSSSSSLVYTQYRDVEAEVFFRGDEIEALGIALGIDRARASLLVAQLGDWRNELALNWREWIQLCCLAQAVRARCFVAASQPSAVNDAKYGPVDPGKVARARQTVLAASQFTASRTTEIEDLIVARVDHSYTSQSMSLLVRGRWLPAYLAWRIKQVATTVDILRLIVGEKALAALFLATLGAGGDWAQYFSGRFEEILNEAKSGKSAAT